MLTYVINTSENKTFDSSRLFELAGYSKIRWIQCTLNDIPKCVEHISERQNNIISDDFRIAVIVDFYGFDRIRIPYGRRGFTSDEGVDMSLYMPYIEVYLLDKLILQLENRELFAKDFEVYYVQNEKSERYELFKNASTQIKKILEGSAGRRDPSAEDIEVIADRSISDDEIDAIISREKLLAEKQRRRELLSVTSDEEEFAEMVAADAGDDDDIVDTEYQKRRQRERISKKVELLLSQKTPEELALYSSFTLYCTPNTSLEFPLNEYPYGSPEMTFEEFWDAFRARTAIKAGLRRHYYIVPYGGGPSRLALHTLSLSLYLIYLYEREGVAQGEGDMDVEKIDSAALCEVLETGWSKINAAKIVAKKNNMQYYSLVENTIMKPLSDDKEEVDPSIAIMNAKAELPKTVTNTNMSGDKLYAAIASFASRTMVDTNNRNRDEFDSIMSEYLRKRDETREADIEAEFLELKNGGFLQTTDQCPSKEQYAHLVKEKQRQISVLFENVLASEYIEVDYSAEKKRAEAAYIEYKKAKAWTSRNLVGDIVFLLLAVLSAVVPYCALQLTSHFTNPIAAVIMALITAGFFGGLFVFSVILQLIPMMRKLSKAKTKLYNCYLDCCAKERYSFSAIRKKYDKDLISIEHSRYELRQLKRLFDENTEKERNVIQHRKMLDAMADCLSSMLNNLDVEPIFDENETVEGEFDLSKSLYARENRVYQVFSLETIEKIFSMKGRDLE